MSVEYSERKRREAGEGREREREREKQSGREGAGFALVGGLA